MPGIPVHLDRSPFNARLLLWGRAQDGWWGLIEWAQTVRRDTRLDSMSFAAWVPAGSLTRPGWTGSASTQATQPARIALPRDTAHWPPPACWHGWYAGVWAAGPVATPDGVETVTGPAWRRR